MRESAQPVPGELCTPDTLPEHLRPLFPLGVGSPVLLFSFHGSVNCFAVCPLGGRENWTYPKVFSGSSSDFIPPAHDTGADGVEWKPMFPFRGRLSIQRLLGPKERVLPVARVV